MEKEQNLPTCQKDALQITPMTRYIFSKEFFIVVCIFLFAYIIRTYNLSTVPHGLERDEVANTYVGRFILQNGKDLYGNPWPLLYFNKFGDYPPVLPMYLSGLATYVFGVSAFAARFPAALFGSLTVFPLYHLLKLLLSKRAAIIGAFLLTILPWHVVLSRSSAEGIFALFTTTMGLFFLFKGITQRKSLVILVSWIWFALSYLLYPAFRITTPLLFLPLPFIVWREKKIRNIILVGTIGFFLLTLLISSTAWGKGRFTQTSFFTNPFDVSQVQDDLTRMIHSEGAHSAIVAHVFYNKPVAYAQLFLKEYLNYFSPDFFFLKGGLPARYAVAHLGTIYIAFLLFGLLALIFSNKKSPSTYTIYFVYLLLISVLPAALTIEDSPNIHRAILMTIPLIFFITIAIGEVVNLLQQKKHFLLKAIIICVCFFFAVELVYDGHQYFTHAGFLNAGDRKDGTMEIAAFLANHNSEYRRIFVPTIDWTPIYYLFYTKDFSASYIGRFALDFRITHIDNIYFVPDFCPSLEKLRHPQFDAHNEDLVLYGEDCTVISDFKEFDQLKRIDETTAYRFLHIVNLR